MWLGPLSNMAVVAALVAVAIFAIPLVWYLGRKAYRTWWVWNDSLNRED